ncbi:alpha/beta hydrolase [Nocardioides taihuensis]|uniref:Alpha/beta hydrolase n=1 Tax=Nocardioides taihuensis TaxID=1835606 RepID=A0ABW0BM83_9ACTN
MRTPSRGTTALVAVAALSLSLLPGLTGPASARERSAAPVPASAGVDAPVPTLDWAPCYSDAPFDCTTATVPLDYDDPTGATTELDLLRVSASDPGNRIGTLFVNPGGPGGASRDFATYFGELVPDVVSQRFDIVGIDPRGVGPSAPMRCRTDTRPGSYPKAYFPRTEGEVKAQLTYDRWVRRACRTDPSPIVGHMTTADTARDMDLVRQALGESQISYYGVSYGTQLGTTYAAMFPGNIRAMILDGVLDPVAWTTGADGTGTTHPFSERLGSGYGAWQGLVNAFAECDRVGRARCPIAGDASGVWYDIIKRLRRGPFKHAGITTTYSDVVGSALGYLYDQGSIRYLMRYLERLHRQMFGDGSPRLVPGAFDPRAVARRVTDDRGLPGPYGAGDGRATMTSGSGWGRISDPFAGVACADSDNPVDERTWVDAARRADRYSPWFGAAWTWASGVCAGWPASTKEDRFTGPFAVTTSAPVLVVGNTFDPATPLHGARAVNRMLDGSRLLVLDGWGHGAIDTGPCINQAYAAYLVDGTLPLAGTVCKPRQQMFPQ